MGRLLLKRTNFLVVLMLAAISTQGCVAAAQIWKAEKGWGWGAGRGKVSKLVGEICRRKVAPKPFNGPFRPDMR